MPVQDLTPQLRTRLSRVERAVGVFVIIATLLLLAGLAFYMYSTAQRKGWTKKKFNYYTYLRSGEGIREGNEVTLLGFPAGRVTKVEAMEPFYWEGNVFIQFQILEPYDGYIYDDSKVRIVAKGFLGERGLEVLLGGVTPGYKPHATYDVTRDKKGGIVKINGVWDDQAGKHLPLSERPKGYGLKADEGVPISERAEKLVGQVEAFLPDLTNKLSLVMSNLVNVTARADTALAEVQPLLTNVSAITANLKDPNGSLGRWILTPELSSQLTQTLANVNITVTNANAMILQAKDTVANTDSNVTKLASGLDMTLINIADMTSNLNAQVQMNTNLVSNINSAIVSADVMMQGLKKHWLLRSAFKEKKEMTPVKKKK
jgi:ABC-type transporter Mla subunit MlaD